MTRRVFLPPGLLVLGLVAALAGCWDDTVNVEFEDPPTTASVAGRVLAWEDGTPVPDAVITIPGPDRSDTTDGEGGFLLTGIAPGSYVARVEAPGRLGLTTELRLPATAKTDRDHWHLDVSVPARSRDLPLTVHAGATGTPLAGVPVRLHDLDLGAEIGAVTVTPGQAGLAGSTDAAGQATLTGLPPCEVVLQVEAAHTDDDGIPDLAGRLVTCDLRHAAAPREVALLPADDPAAPVVVATDLGPSPQEAPVVTAPVLTLEFDQPMVTDPRVTTVERGLRGDGGGRLELAPRWVSPTRLEIVPSEAVDQELMVLVLAYGASGLGVVHQGHVDWRADGPADGTPCDGVVTGLTLAIPAELIDHDTTELAVAFDALVGADGYVIHARDDAGQPTWTPVAEWASDWDTGTISRAFRLPSSFDSHPDDGRQTPLAGTTVELCVVPRNATDPAPGDPHPIIAVSDGVAPQLASVTVDGAPVNDTAQPATLDVVVRFSEFLADGVPAPTLTVQEAGGDPAWALDPAAATWTWGPDRHEGRFRFTLPAGADASGDICRVTATDLVDLAGNATAGPVDSGDVTITGSYGFDFEDGPAGWTVENDPGTTWELGAPTHGPAGAFSGISCWATDLDADYQNDTDASLVSPPLDLDMPDPQLRFQAWLDIENSWDELQVQVDGGGGWTTLATFDGHPTSWQPYTVDLADHAGQTVQLRFRFASDFSVVFAGAFIDDVEVGSAD